MVKKEPKRINASSPQYPVAIRGPAESTPGMSTMVHCPYRQASLLQQALVPAKMKVAFFLGAGCPVSVRVPDGSGTRPLIPDVEGMTREVCRQMEASPSLKTTFGNVIKRLNGMRTVAPTIEDILSHARSLRDVVGAGKIDGMSHNDLDSLDLEIGKIIERSANAKLPTNETPYHLLATWITAIYRPSPVEIFTTNYDLLMEQALEERRAPYFDGFIGSDRSFFDLPSMEQDKLPSRWSRLWKVHGSINWWQTSDGHVERRDRRNDDARLLIHPSHLKYDQSRRMPYLAMLDRLRAFLGVGQSVLVTCGYSFADQHLNDVMIQGLAGNPKAILFALVYGDRQSAPNALAQARKQGNFNVLAVDGAILGTIERDWTVAEIVDHPLAGLAVRVGDLEDRTSAPEERCKFVLGDFSALGKFLAYQIADVNANEQEYDAT